MMAIYLTLLIWLWAPRVSHRSCLTSERERERKLSARSRPTNPVAHFHCGQKGCNVIFACLFAALVSLFAERACYINTNELRHQSESLHVIVLNANPPRVCVVGFENYTHWIFTPCSVNNMFIALYYSCCAVMRELCVIGDNGWQYMDENLYWIYMWRATVADALLMLNHSSFNFSLSALGLMFFYSSILPFDTNIYVLLQALTIPTGQFDVAFCSIASNNTNLRIWRKVNLISRDNKIIFNSRLQTARSHSQFSTSEVSHWWMKHFKQ